MQTPTLTLDSSSFRGWRSRFLRLHYCRSERTRQDGDVFPLAPCRHRRPSDDVVWCGTVGTVGLLVRVRFDAGLSHGYPVALLPVGRHSPAISYPVRWIYHRAVSSSSS